MNLDSSLLYSFIGSSIVGVNVSILLSSVILLDFLNDLISSLDDAIIKLSLSLMNLRISLVSSSDRFLQSLIDNVLLPIIDKLLFNSLAGI